MNNINEDSHCVKNVRIRSYSGSHFSRIFPHSDFRIQSECGNDAEYLSVFSPNAKKCGKDAEYLSVFSPNAGKCGKDAEYLSVFSPNAKKCGPE